MSSFPNLKQLRNQLSQKLIQLIPNQTIVDKEMGRFDVVVSRRAFLGKAGKLTALAALVGSGLPPSVWANTNSSYQVNDPNLQLTDSEMQQVNIACSVSLSGELMDEQLTVQSAQMFKQFDRRHVMFNGMAATPYIQTMPDESADPSHLFARGESELLGLDEHNNLVHMYRDHESGHGFKMDVDKEVAQVISGQAVDELFVLSHQDNGTVVDDWIVGSWGLWIQLKSKRWIQWFRTLKINVNDSSKRQDTGWKIMGGWQYGTLVDVFYGDGKDQVPCVHFMMTSDTHMSEWKYGPEASLVHRFKDIEDIAAAPNQLNTEETSYSWQGMVEHLDNLLRIRLVSANRSTGQYTFASYHFGPTPDSSFVCGLVSYTVDFDSFITLKPSGAWTWKKSHSQVSEEFTADSYYMLGDPYSYKVFPAPCFDGQISVIFSAKPVYAGDTLYYQVTLPAPGDKNFDEVGLRMIPTLPNPHDDPSDKRHYLSISDLHLQTNSDGIQSLVIQDERGNVYQRRQNCQRQDPNNILSPFVPIEPAGQLDSWFEAQWQPLDAGCIGLIAPPLTSQDSEYLVAKLSPNSQAVEYHSTQVVKYSLTAQDETIMVPMSEASVQANVNKGQQQATDTYYHAELNVQNIYGYSVGANQPIELRSSKPDSSTQILNLG